MSRPCSRVPSATAARAGPGYVRVADQLPEACPQSVAYVPCIDEPDTVPVYVTVTAPCTAPKLIVEPAIVPLIAPPVRQGVPVMVIVPVSAEPCWVQTMVNPPVAWSGVVFAQVPVQVPERPARPDGGAVDGVAAAVGLGAPDAVVMPAEVGAPPVGLVDGPPNGQQPAVRTSIPSAVADATARRRPPLVIPVSFRSRGDSTDRRGRLDAVTVWGARNNGQMDDPVAAYLAGMAPEHRPLFDRLAGLVRELYPDATLTLSYQIPTFRAGRGRLYLGAWQHGLSVYGWDASRDGGFLQRHPELKTGKGTVQLRPEAAAAIADDEFRDLIRAALDR
jgi:uncharacterized protein YdhG (YjbR/CyaY superfamily)